MVAYILGASFALMVTCLMVCLISGFVLFFLRWRDINGHFKHPLLEIKPFKHYPMSLQAAMTLDYFLHLMFPKGKSGMIGNANHMLRHVDAKQLPLSVRWPVAGFWGGCFFGIIFMVTAWVTMILIR